MAKKGGCSSPIDSGSKGLPPNMPRGAGKGNKSPTSTGSKGVPSMSGVKSYKAPRD